LWPEVTEHGVALVAVRHPGVSEGSDGYRLPQEVADFIAGHPPAIS
jgi:hypothetical protein